MRVIMKLKWNWCGNIVRSKEKRWNKEMIIPYYWLLSEREKRKEKHGLRCYDGMRSACGGTVWTTVVYDRKAWEIMAQVNRCVYV